MSREALRLSTSLSLGFRSSYSSRQGYDHDGEGFLSVRHDGSGRRLRNDGRDADPLPERAATPWDMDDIGLQIDDSGSDEEGQIHKSLLDIDVHIDDGVSTQVSVGPLDPLWQPLRTKDGREYYRHLMTGRIRWDAPRLPMGAQLCRDAVKRPGLGRALPPAPGHTDEIVVSSSDDDVPMVARRRPGDHESFKTAGLPPPPSHGRHANGSQDELESFTGTELPPPPSRERLGCSSDDDSDDDMPPILPPPPSHEHHADGSSDDDVPMGTWHPRGDLESFTGTELPAPPRHDQQSGASSEDEVSDFIGSELPAPPSQMS